MDWSLLLGAGIGIVATIVGGIGLELAKNWAKRKGKIEMYCIAALDYGGTQIRIRLQVKNLTQSDYIIRNIQLVEINEKYDVVKTYGQKSKTTEPIPGLIIRQPKIDGDEGEFSFVIYPRSIKELPLDFDNYYERQDMEIELDNELVDTYENVYSEINIDKLALQYFDEQDKIITLQIEVGKNDWIKLESIIR